MERTTRKNILYKDLSYKLGGVFFQTQDTLGRFAREKQYGNLLEARFKENGINYEREKLISRTGGDINKADFIIEGVILIEIKAKPFVQKDDYYQVLRYLEFSNLPLGIIVNFRQKYLRPNRIINAKVRVVSD